MGQCLHQNGNCFRDFVAKRLLARWGFPALYFNLLTNEIEGKHATCEISHFVNTVKTTGDQRIMLVNRIMNSDNVPKELVKSFIDLANVVKELMGEKQQPSLQEELEF